MSSSTTVSAPRGRHAAPREVATGARWWWIGGAAVLAVLAYVPTLAVQPGVITPDTKTYLYLDPLKFLSQVAFMWNPTVALGTVPHQYIGYLLPMGPFYAVFHLVGVPVWVAQRLWLGSILFLAGVGILYLSRVLGLSGPGPTAAALAYMLSPYFLQYAGRISVILLPWAGLPFMLGLTIVALRRGGWREPAIFAIVVALVSGINATSIIYVGVAPILWLLYAVVVLREATWRHAFSTGLKIGVLTLGACLWWIAGLEVEAAYGVNVLKYTETVPSTSATSNATDILRGLGYWYFYGTDHLGPWTNAAVRFTQDVALLATSFAVPVLAVVAAAFVRWRERAYFLVLLFVGLVLAVGPFPFTHPTAIGGVLKSFMTDTTAGLALRSTDRATPLVLLALSMLLGSGLTALYRRLTVVGIVTALAVAALVVANNPSLFNGDIVANNFTQPASLPAYEMAAINHLNATHPGTRVFAIPGNDFASYRWGDTIDTPQPAFLNRDFVTREQQIMGSIATADTLYAIDGPMQDGIANMNALAPMARLMSVGDVMVQYDENYEHYGVPQPQLLALQLLQTPLGLSDPMSFGSPRPNVSMVSTLNEQDLSVPGNLTWPSPVVTYTVADPRPTLRGESDTGAIVMEGDATGLNNLAGLGLLNTDSAIYYAGTLANDPARLSSLATQGAQLVVTDTNRKQAFRWDTLTANAGYTETPSDNPAKTDQSDSPIELFPGTTDTSKTYATYVGAVNVTASSYGNSVSYTPEDQAYSAIDGNLDTAWITGTFVPDPAGQWWQAQLADPVTTDHITLVQPQRGDRSRWVSGVTLTFDGKDPTHYALTAASHLPAGQTLTFPTQTFRTLRVTLDGTTDDTAPPLSAAAVGFSEIQIPGVQVRQVLQMPTQMLSTLGGASQADRLTVVMTRDRSSSFPPRSDPETTIARTFTLPTARTFTLSGSASLSALIPDDEIDRLVGRTPAAATGLASAYSSGRLPGDLRATASATVDGDSTTVWQPGLGTSSQLGTTLTYNLTKPQTLTNLTMQVVADGRHSVPTSMTIASGTQVRKVTLPPIADSTVPNAVTTVPVSFPALTGQTFVVTFTGVRDEYAANYYSAGPLALPLGIAEIGIPNVKSAPTPVDVPGNCVSNLLTIDGQPIDVAVVGATQQALDNGEMQLVPCGADAKGISLSAGTHVVQTAVGHNPPCASAPVHVHGVEHRPAGPRLGRQRRGRPGRRPDRRRHAGAAGDAGGSRPDGDADGFAPGQPERHGDRRRRPVRARPRPEREQGLAGGGRARGRGAGRFARGGPRPAAAGRRLRQRLARDGGRPGGSRRGELHRGPHLDAPERDLGGAGPVGRDAAAVPADGIPARALAARPARPPAAAAAWAGGSGRAGTTGRALRRHAAGPAHFRRPLGRRAPAGRLAVRPGPAHRRRHGRCRPAGGATAGGSGRGRRGDGGTPRALAARRRHSWGRRLHRRRLPQRHPRAAGAPLHARVELGRLLRQRREPDLVGCRPAAGRRRDLGVRLAVEEAPGRRALRAGTAGPGPAPAPEAAPEATDEDRPEETSEEPEETSEVEEKEALGDGPEAPEPPEETPAPAAEPEDAPEDAPEETPAGPSAPPEGEPEMTPEAPEEAPAPAGEPEQTPEEAPEEIPAPEPEPEQAPEQAPPGPAAPEEAPAPATPIAPEETPADPAAPPEEAPASPVAPEATPADPAAPPEETPASPVAPEVTPEVSPEDAPVPVSPG